MSAQTTKERILDIASIQFEDDGGAYLAPQILVGVNHEMRVMREESFGPVVGIMKVRSGMEVDAVAATTTSASRTACSHDVTRAPSDSASFSARSGVRFQILMSSKSRTHANASI